jgi:hypothetical protein
MVSGDDGKIVAFAAALQWVVFAERVSGEFFGHDEAAEIGVAREADPKEIPDLALQPVGPLPERHHALYRRFRIVDEDADGEPLVRGDVGEEIHQSVAVLRGGIVEVVDAGDIDQQVEAASLQERQDLERLRLGDHQSGLSTKDGGIGGTESLPDGSDHIIDGGGVVGHGEGG